MPDRLRIRVGLDQSRGYVARCKLLPGVGRFGSLHELLEIADDLEAALEQFTKIAAQLGRHSAA